MRSYSVLVAFALAFVVLLGLQFLPWQIVGAETSVSVDVNPDTLNLEMHGKWITVYIRPSDGYEVDDIDISTVKLEGVLSPELWKLQDDKLMMKFSAELVIGLIWLKISHMGTPMPIMPQDSVPVELTITGELNDGTTRFEGSDEIRVIAPSIPSL